VPGTLEAPGTLMINSVAKRRQMLPGCCDSPLKNLVTASQQLPLNTGLIVGQKKFGAEVERFLGNKSIRFDLIRTGLKTRF
jgi:hypothetical protein